MAQLVKIEIKENTCSSLFSSFSRIIKWISQYNYKYKWLLALRQETTHVQKFCCKIWRAPYRPVTLITIPIVYILLNISIITPFGPWQHEYFSQGLSQPRLWFLAYSKDLCSPPRSHHASVSGEQTTITILLLNHHCYFNTTRKHTCELAFPSVRPRASPPTASYQTLTTSGNPFCITYGQEEMGDPQNHRNDGIQGIE